MDSCAHCWVKNWMDSWVERVMENADTFSWWLVTNSIPQGSVLTPDLFNNFINDLGRGHNEHSVNYFTDDTKMGKSVDLL